MLAPAPTSKIDPRLARGTLSEILGASATRPELLVVTFPNTSYRLHLVPLGTGRPAVGGRAIGIIRARARRVDTVVSGGRYVEPVFGRPRRVQGRVVAIDSQRNTIVVDAGMPIHAELTDPRAGADAFREGQFVSFDVLDGASFEPAQP